MFKAGDKVVCVDSVCVDISLGRTYEVESIVEFDCLRLKEAIGRYHNTRFVLASEYSAAENLKEQTALDIQHGGQHYKGMKIQPVEFIHANNIGYMEGNAIKYLCRWQMKNGLEDLNKAKHYIELLIEMETASESKD